MKVEVHQSTLSDHRGKTFSGKTKRQILRNRAYEWWDKGLENGEIDHDYRFNPYPLCDHAKIPVLIQ